MSNSVSAFLESEDDSTFTEIIQPLGNRLPNSHGFLSNDNFENELNWLPCGILPTKLLFDRFKNSTKHRLYIEVIDCSTDSRTLTSTDSTQRS
ncbi:hypothetical protein DsansV1_C01g0002251 [Dioscorea sansibarensis]